MIYDFIRLLFSTCVGTIVSVFNIKTFLNFHDVLNGIVGILVGALTIVFLTLQIKKIILDIKIKKKNLKK